MYAPFKYWYDIMSDIKKVMFTKLNNHHLNETMFIPPMSKMKAVKNSVDLGFMVLWFIQIMFLSNFSATGNSLGQRSCVLWFLCNRSYFFTAYCFKQRENERGCGGLSVYSCYNVITLFQHKVPTRLCSTRLFWVFHQAKVVESTIHCPHLVASELGWKKNLIWSENVIILSTKILTISITCWSFISWLNSNDKVNEKNIWQQK